MRILCFGDSNTWGTIGKWEENDLPSERYRDRWTVVLQRELGPDYTVIEEGLGGRTTVYPHPTEPWKMGEPYLHPCLHSHRPLDWVVIMLGTNDLQLHKSITAEELPLGISRLIDVVQSYPKIGQLKILIVAPPEVRPSSPLGRTEVYAKFRGDIGRALSLQFPAVYAQVAANKGCRFLNGQDYVTPGEADGVHLDAASHIRLGKAIADFIRKEEGR